MNISKISHATSFKALAATDKDRQTIRDAYQNNQLIAFDIDTQDDFMFQHKNPRDGLYVGGAEEIVENLGVLTSLGKVLAIPKINTMDTHSEDDPEFKLFEAVSDGHCIKGTNGWKKITETIDERENQVIDVDPERNDAPTGPQVKTFISNGDVLTIEKNTYDLTKHADEEGTFHDNDKTIGILENIKKAGIKVAIVYGVVTNICVQATVDALKKIGIKPIVVEDAVKEIGADILKDPNDKTFGDVSIIKTKDLAGVLNTAA